MGIRVGIGGPPPDKAKENNLQGLGSYLWGIFVIISLIPFYLDGGAKKSINFVLSNVDLWIVFQNLLIIMLVSYIIRALFNIHWLFKFSLGHLFSNKSIDDESAGTNISLIPAKIKYFGIVFVVIIALVLPELARLEEEIFRAGTTTWVEGILRSLAFGFAHCLVGVPIAAGFALSIGGLWFTFQYLLGGVHLSTVHHTTYNLIIITLLFITLVIQHIKEFQGDESVETG